MIRTLVVSCLIFSLGCSLGPAAAQQPTATLQRSQPSTLVPTVGRLASQVQPTQTETPLPPPTQTAAPTTSPEVACTPSDDATTQHRVTAQIDYSAKVVLATQEVTYTNQTDSSLSTILLNVEPNRWTDVFTLQSVEVDDVPAIHTLDGRQLLITLSEALDPDCTATFSLSFALRVPPIIGGPESFRGYFGQSPRQINLGHWLPTVAPYADGEWVHEPTILIGEQLVLTPAHWNVNIQLLNAPASVQVAAPGTLTRPDATTWTFDHRNGREFAVSISGVFRVASSSTASGIQVDVFTMPDATVPDGSGGWLDGGAYAAQLTAQSIELFASRFGPFPHDRMVIVQGDFPDGMEFSGFAFVSTDWFVAYDGTPAGYLMLITVHEVAHQWWYDLVGNNQARSPWLDEALSTYSEYIFIEEYYPALAEWWWFFRVNRLDPQGNVDSTVYDFDAIRPYINAVYLRGVLLLHEVRLTLGDEAFYAWLQVYADQNAGAVATAADLWAALPPEQLDLTAFTRAVFLRSPAGG